MEILEPPYLSDLGTSRMNPLLELGTRPRPIEDAWGFTLRNRMALHVGAHARPERSLLVLGPPRDTGKTTSVLVPTVLVAFAPVVAASTKDDVFAAIAQARALMGRLWHFAPDGTEPTPTGARKLRWSPVPAAADWDMAVTTAEVMVSVANATLGGHSADGGFWSIQAGGLLAPLLHAAALGNRDMRTVMRWVMLRDLQEAAGILEGLKDRSAGTRTAWDLLVGATRTARNELSGYWGSANAALAPYRREAALEVTDRPNFDPQAFVLGSRRPHNPGLLSYDTLYINSSGLNQERLAPLIVALLTEIKEARYRLHRIARADQPGAYLPPTVLALDETANIAPIPDLPSIISQGGSQGVVVVAVFHHLGQAKARWGNDGLGFLTTFQERLVFPGIWERETLEAISVVIGGWDRPITSYLEDAHSTDPRRSSYQHSFTRQPILSPAEIQAGRPEVPEAALFLQGRSYGWIHTTPYYACPPWPHLLVTAMERWAAAPADYPQRALPIPELDRVDPTTGVPWLWQAGGQPLWDRYHQARDALRRPPPRPLPR
ncbi:MAG TPA: TraM recognition domain-containing protein [Anaeromyxobacteraceae bacterium]|nr:TraM recognition domain-containing protein [Anaeromyxobacteraceae bacterium]